MPGLNKATLIGRVGETPELRTTYNGVKVTTFTLGTTETRIAKTGGQVQHTEWHSISAFGKMAEKCAKYAQEGDLIYIEGKLQQGQHERHQAIVYTSSILLRVLKFLDPDKEKEVQNNGT